MWGISAAIAGYLLQLAACEYWHLSVNQDGLVLVTVIGDHPRSPDRFRVRTVYPTGHSRLWDVPDSGRLSLRSAVDGTLEITLLLPTGCSVPGSNPQELVVSAGETVRADFDVHCNVQPTRHVH